jgi:hypothetical protein
MGSNVTRPCAKFVTAVRVVKNPPYTLRVEYLRGVSAINDVDHIEVENISFETKKEAVAIAQGLKYKTQCLRCGNPVHCMKPFGVTRR